MGKTYENSKKDKMADKKAGIKEGGKKDKAMDSKKKKQYLKAEVARVLNPLNDSKEYRR